MAIASLPFTNGFYKSPSLPVSAQDCLNCYVNIPDVPSMSEQQLFGSPGMTQFATASTSESGYCRGARVMDGTPYFVLGNTLYSMDSIGTLTSKGTISGSSRVSMSDNGTQLMICVPGGTGYIFTGPSTLATISDTDYTTTNGVPQQVTFVDGYFVVTTDAKKFKISAINDGTSWNALDFGTAESSPDGTITPIVFKNQLFIVGEVTTEAFNNLGGADFPFQRSGIFLDEGTTSPFSVINASETFMWIGGGKNESPAVWALSGNSTEKISTQSIDDILQGLTTDELTDIYAQTYAQGGHYFVAWSLPTTTIVFDTSTGVWHERQSRITDGDGNVTTGPWRVNAMANAYGKIFAGDTQDGRIGLLSTDTFDEYDNRIMRRFATMPFVNNQQPFTVPYLELTMEAGVGNADEDDPQVTLERSIDGGKSWEWSKSRAIGKIGEYDRRAVWRRLGRVDRYVVYRFTMSAPVKPVFIALTGDIVGVSSGYAA